MKHGRAAPDCSRCLTPEACQADGGCALSSDSPSSVRVFDADEMAAWARDSVLADRRRRRREVAGVLVSALAGGAVAIAFALVAMWAWYIR